MRILGLFAKQPLPGTVKTRLACEIGDLAAAGFAAAAIRELLTNLHDIGDERILGYAPDNDSSLAFFQEHAGNAFQIWPQPSGDLGERIERFFESTLGAAPQDSRRSVLIGSDSPHLPTKLIEDAFMALNTHDLVLGPSVDGGYYLIGMRRQPAGWLNGVRWSSEFTLSDTVRAARTAGLSLAVLTLWSDIDTLSDLRSLAGWLAAKRYAEPQRSPGPVELWLADTLPHLLLSSKSEEIKG